MEFIWLRSLYSLLFNLFFRFRKKTDIVPQTKNKKSLDHPLSHYYIQGSHNTYLLGNQLVGSSTIDGYKRAIKNGCRCVELDLYNGCTEAVIYHGHTLTSKLIAREVLQHGIMSDFQKDSLPLFLSIEDNITSDEQRLCFIQDLKNICGDFLYNQNISGMTHLPSPNDLRGKIIIMAPKIQWGELANICQNVPFPKNALASSTYEGNCFEISSLSEHTLNGLITPTFEENDETAALDRIMRLRNLTKNNLIRYYPGFHRQLSGNFDPIPGMNAGCQIAAMNVQTKSSNLTIIESRFREHGSTGFALKPNLLLNANASSLLGTKLITIKGIKGHRLLDHQNKNKSKFLFVNFRVNGIKEDKVEKNTKPLNTDGKNPKWNEDFTFTLTVPELGFILIQVKSSNIFGLKIRTIGSYSIPITEMKNGSTIIRLQDQFGNQHSHASLCIEVTIKDHSPRFQSRAAKSC